MWPSPSEVWLHTAPRLSVCPSVSCMLVTQKRKVAKSSNLKHMIPATIVTDLVSFRRRAESQGHYGSQCLWTTSTIHDERLLNFAEILSPQSAIDWIFQLWKVKGQCYAVRMSVCIVASDLVHAHDLYKNELQSSYMVHKWLMTAQSPVS